MKTGALRARQRLTLKREAQGKTAGERGAGGSSQPPTGALTRKSSGVFASMKGIFSSGKKQRAAANRCVRRVIPLFYSLWGAAFSCLCMRCACFVFYASPPLIFLARFFFARSYKASSAEESSPTFVSSGGNGSSSPTVPKLAISGSAASTSEPQQGASSSTDPAPLSNTATLPTGTPRPGALPPPAPLPPPGAGVGPGTPRILEQQAAAESAAAGSGTHVATPRPGYTPSGETPLPSAPVVRSAAASSGVVVVATAALDDVKLDDEETAGDDDDNWTAESELPKELSSKLEGELDSAKAELTRMLALEAAKFLLAKRIQPADAPPPLLNKMIESSLSMRKEALAAGRPKPPSFGDISEMERVECESRWRGGMQQLFTRMREASYANAAQETATPWCNAVLETKKEVMDPNEKRLEEHLLNMYTEHVGAAKKDLAGSRLRDVMKAHALTVHKTLKGAMDDVERQFREGMKPLLAARLPSLDETSIVALITACIKAFRVGFDRPWAIQALEKQLAGSMVPSEPEPSLPEPTTPLRASTSISSDPVGYLLGLILGAAELPLNAEVRDFLCTAVARYLDPFIDGEVKPGEYLKRSEGSFMSRLKAAWVSEYGEASPMPNITPECALAQYTAHAIAKMNANFGFGMHTPGLGRQPASEQEASRYFEQLGKHLVAAIQRDFEEGDRQFGVSADIPPPPQQQQAHAHARISQPHPRLSHIAVPPLSPHDRAWRA